MSYPGVCFVSSLCLKYILEQKFEKGIDRFDPHTTTMSYPFGSGGGGSALLTPFGGVGKKRLHKKNMIDARTKRELERRIRDMRKRSPPHLADRIAFFDKLMLMLDLLERQKVTFQDYHVRDMMSTLHLYTRGDSEFDSLTQKLQQMETDSLTPLGRISENKFVDFKNMQEIHELKDELQLAPSEIDKLGQLSPRVFDKFYDIAVHDLFHPYRLPFPQTSVFYTNSTQFEVHMEKVLMTALHTHNFALFKHLVDKHPRFMHQLNFAKTLCLSPLYYNDVHIFQFLRESFPDMPFHMEDIELALEKCEKDIDPKGVCYFTTMLKEMDDELL